MVCLNLLRRAPKRSERCQSYYPAGWSGSRQRRAFVLRSTTRMPHHPKCVDRPCDTSLPSLLPLPLRAATEPFTATTPATAHAHNKNPARRPCFASQQAAPGQGSQFFTKSGSSTSPPRRAFAPSCCNAALASSRAFVSGYGCCSTFFRDGAGGFPAGLVVP